VGFEPTFPAFERAKTVHALDRAATVIGPINIIRIIKLIKRCEEYVADLNIDGRIILKLILKMLNGKVWTEFIRLKIETNDGLLCTRL
jgi:hypothetical protein